jgi:hypothetical protein
LAACVETGDLGRPKPTILSDWALPATGSLAARARGEPVSGFPLTDAEDELRDRAWRFVMPAHERAWLDRSVAELVRTRLLPLDQRPRWRDGYFAALSGEGARSPASRYGRLAEDALADARLVEPFARTAVRVLAADQVRLRSLAYVRDLSETQLRDAAARIAENRCLVAWVRDESRARVASYRFALERLVVATPQDEAVTAERAVRTLEVHRRTLDGFDVGALEGGVCGGGSPSLAPLGPSLPVTAKG